MYMCVHVVCTSVCCVSCVQYAIRSDSNTTVDVYPSIVYSTDNYDDKKICGSVFNKYGACCKQDDVEKLVVARVRRMKREYAAYKKEMVLIKQYNIQYIKISYEITKSYFTSRIMKNDTFSEIGGVVNSQHFLRLLNGLSVHVDVHQKKMNNYTSFEEKCFSTILTYRSDSMCLICSGDGSSYFNSSSNMLNISNKTCMNIIQSCKHVFYTMAVSKAIIFALRGMTSYRSILDIDTLDTMMRCTEDDFNCPQAYCSYISTYDTNRGYEKMEDVQLSDNRRILQQYTYNADTKYDGLTTTDMQYTYSNGYTVDGNTQFDTYSRSYTSYIKVVYNIMIVYIIIYY